MATRVPPRVQTRLSPVTRSASRKGRGTFSPAGAGILDGANEKLQPGKIRHIGNDAGGIQALLSGGDPRLLYNPSCYIGKYLPRLSVESDQRAEIMERLLADVALERVDVQGMSPPEIELQRTEHLHIGEVVHLF